VPSRLLVFQVEPTAREVERGTWEHIFRFGVGVCYWLADGQVVDQETTIFRRPQEWSRWLSGRRDNQRSTWVYSYGLVYGLTLLNAFRGWDGSGERLISAVLSDPPTIVLTRQGRHITRYVDVANYSRDGLRSLLRSAGVTAPCPLKSGTSEQDAIAYCTSKTLAVGDFLCQAISLVRRSRLCGWQPTAASLSFAAYRHSFAHSDLYIHGQPDATSLERASLFGGRVQTWCTGSINQSVTIVDANSLYPSVMRDYPHPVKFRSHQWGGAVRELHQALRGYWCAATVTLGAAAPELPRRVGRAVYWDDVPGPRSLCGAELHQAVALGCVKRVHAIARYDAGFSFTDFVDTLFNHKLRLTKEKNHGQAALCKILLNSLHGKFAQHGRRWVEAKETLAAGQWRQWWGTHPKTGAYVPYRCLGGYSQYCETAGEWLHSFPGISASISSAARIELARARDFAGVAQTLYCDTDSLHLVGRATDRLVAGNFLHPTSLGKWKTVTTGADATYWGLKHYRVGNKYCCCYLTPSAWQVADGIYRDAARLHFGRLLDQGLPDAVYYRERTVRVRDVDSGERRELIDYEEVA